ncbi:Rpn family recombination-promoting nuclease/putative transposase [Klebsiella oxytoca]|nr:Rpn family recombination-promoting nuclease/putative transposase [Klebsiella oxytoca]ELG4820419.1 Rpn family recombination-promoting nuclease/putative transposase [Klebsiella oxytoca]ELK5562455.1 Rpn family recombination-promoting nuclease/putative transposase [Klebsiella oxytoca]ELK5573559.1 Rpn family recombination-promoting nuclease/putative transposase [Klebsiella oxytoca]ELM1665371.1 Rpn family recombination-promoting nuclease/putative transposase [Klebsiella oxytoca]MDM4082088.1 Rpn f
MGWGHHQLPRVIPLLFYHGRISPYPHSTRGWTVFLYQRWPSGSIARTFH